MHTILGIDPGFDRLGFGLIKVDGAKTKALDFGVITTSKTTDFGERLVQIEEDLESLIKSSKPDLVSLEKLYTTVNQKTAMRVAESRGVVLLVVARHGLPIVEFAPNQVKSAVTGDGGADKKAMQKMVARLLGLSRVPKPDDAADALAIALTAVGRLSLIVGKK
jgi:crossover junction endodeoxyribonuclease RuvC